MRNINLIPCPNTVLIQGTGWPTVLEKKSRTFEYLFRTHSHNIYHVILGVSGINIIEKIAHRGNNDFEKLKLKKFQDPLPPNSKIFKTLLGFQ